MFKSRKKAASKAETEKAVKKEAVPTSAGVPEIDVHKSWTIGDFRVRSADGRVHVEKLYDFYGVKLVQHCDSTSFPKELAPAIADAILQAS